MKIDKMQELIISAKDELLERIRDSFATRKGWNTARKYIHGLMSGAERKNGWQLSEQLGEETPYRLQQFLYRGSWDADRVRDQLRGYVCEHLGEPDRVPSVKRPACLQRKSGTENKQAPILLQA